MELALAACLGWVVTTCLFIKHLADVNHGHRLHITSLLNRIQAPEHAVAQELVKEEQHETVILPHTEESYWSEVEHKEAA